MANDWDIAELLEPTPADLRQELADFRMIMALVDVAQAYPLTRRGQGALQAIRAIAADVVHEYEHEDRS